MRRRLPRRRHATLAALAVVAGAGLACDTGFSAGSAEPGAVSGTVTVSAAASLTEPFRAISEDFEHAHPGVTVTVNLGSSRTLARQIADGAPADVFASADEASMAVLAGADLVAGEPRPFARNRLTIAVAPGNPAGIASLADLPGAGTVALCGREAPCGRYAGAVLARAGVAIPIDRVTRAPDVKGAVRAVARGDAAAALVYVTDVTGEAVEAVAIADEHNVVASYPIAVCEPSANRAVAQAFVAHVLGPAGQARLAAAGFMT